MGQEELPIEQKYEQLYFEYQAQGFQLRDTLETLERIQPIYEKLYRNPFYWFVRPHDPHLTGKMLFRCRTCNGLFWKDGPKEFTAHLGHLYSPARSTTFFEWVKLKLGLIR